MTCQSSKLSSTNMKALLSIYPPEERMNLSRRHELIIFYLATAVPFGKRFNLSNRSAPNHQNHERRRTEALLSDLSFIPLPLKAGDFLVSIDAKCNQKGEVSEIRLEGFDLQGFPSVTTLRSLKSLASLTSIFTKSHRRNPQGVGDGAFSNLCLCSNLTSSV